MSTLIKTEGIVLDHVLYRETSAIVHLYTRELGRQNYIVNGVRGARKNKKTALLQPLNQLSMEVYHSHKKDLHRISEFSLQQPLVTIPYRQNARAQAFFLTELLSKVLIMQDPAPELFDFLKNSVNLLDSEVDGSENLHLYVMFQLAYFLGFAPTENYTSGNYFDMKNGNFVASEPPHSFFLPAKKAGLFARLFNINVYSLKKIAINVTERQIILDALLDFYRLHTPNFGTLHTLDVLHSMLRS